MDVLSAAKRFSSEIITVTGGVHETYCSIDTLNHYPQVDFAFAGESDTVFVPFLDALPNWQTAKSLPGLNYRVNGEVISNPPQNSTILLDSLPIPNRELLENSSAYNFRIFSYQRTTQVQTMRGCPFQCSFCNQRNRTPLLRSIDSVCNELGVLKNQGYASIFMDDATFTMDRRRTLALAREIKRVGDNGFACQTLRRASGSGFSSRDGRSRLFVHQFRLRNLRSCGVEKCS